MSSSSSSDDDDGLICTPPEIIEQAKIATDNLLPTRSRERYEIIYQKFMDWRLRKNIKSFSENVMLVYFKELSTTMKPSSLWAIYSMLKSTLSSKHDKI